MLHCIQPCTTSQIKDKWRGYLNFCWNWALLRKSKAPRVLHVHMLSNFKISKISFASKKFLNALVPQSSILIYISGMAPGEG